MNEVFTVGAVNLILAQPSVPSKLYARADGTYDSSHTLSYTGIVSGTPTVETQNMNSQSEMLTTNTFTSLSKLALSSTHPNLVIDVFQLGVAAKGAISVCGGLPANNDTLRIGALGWTTYTFKTTLTGGGVTANEILIAPDVNTQATYIYEMLNHGANAGTHYGSATLVNFYVTASAPVGAAVTITDKIACRRSVDWILTQTVGSSLDLTTPVGGVDGTLIASFASGVTDIYAPFSLDSPTLAVATLPAKLFPTTDPILINGKSCLLMFKCENVGTAIPLKYRTSTDKVNWNDGVTPISSLDDNSVITPRIVAPAERNIEYIQIAFTANANTSNSKVDARVIYPSI